jgi:hypothetical protein
MTVPLYQGGQRKYSPSDVLSMLNVRKNVRRKQKKGSGMERRITNSHMVPKENWQSDQKNLLK